MTLCQNGQTTVCSTTTFRVVIRILSDTGWFQEIQDPIGHSNTGWFQENQDPIGYSTVIQYATSLIGDARSMVLGSDWQIGLAQGNANSDEVISTE